MTDDRSLGTQATDSDIEPPERRRTVLIWLIMAWFCFSMVVTLISLGMGLLGIVPAGIPKPSPIQYALSTIGIGLFFASSLSLFNLRAKAVKLLAAALAFNVGATLYNLFVILPVQADLPAPLQNTWFMFGNAATGPLVYGALLAYAVRLRRRGVLL